MRSIKTKLIVMYAAVVLVVMIVSGTFMLYNVRDMETEQTHEALRRHANAINDRIVQAYDSMEGFWGTDQWVMLGQTEYEIEGMILTDVGIPIAPGAFVRPDLRFNDRAVLAAMGGSEGFTVGSLGLDVDGAERQWFTFAMPVSNAEGDFIVYARVDTRFMNESLSRLTLSLVTTVLIALVLTVVFWFFLANTLTNPIVAMTRHAKDLASGNLTREIKVSSNDEIGQLAYNFNYMARELRATLSSMAAEKSKSEAILQNTSHGVLAYDAAGQLIHANNASAELLQGVDIGQTHVSDALRLLGFDPAEVYRLNLGGVLESIYESGEHFLSAAATPYTSETGQVDGYVIVLQDITRQRKLENMRKEFVANVSHELRTPLTSIRASTETLLDGAMEEAEIAARFLKVIDDESQRMALLISDLLELSRIDSKHTVLELDVVDLGALLRLAIRQSQILAGQKNQKIILDSPGGPYFIDANAARINQVITNILSNSIKYSPEGTEIRVAMETTEKYYRVFIQDQGIGIPTDSIGRVFERFYRVDKARSRAMGGTGLGLAIVKEIMEEHGGRVHASSTPGQGTTMILRFNRLSE